VSEPQAQQYAISKWHDTDEVYARLRELVRQPIRPIRRERMQQFLDYFETRCVKSKALTDEAKKYIPGGVQHNLAFNYPFPLAVEKAEGAYMWDVDGNRYIDFLQAGGPTVLGSNYAPVRDKVTELLQSCGPVTGLFHEYELKLAKLINRLMPSVEMFRMLGSGTEAVMAAIRAARAFTGRKKVVKVGGAYHGWSDQMVYGLHIPGTRRLEATGIPRGASRYTQEFYPHSLGQLRRLMTLNRLRGGTAAVIVEPLGPESGTRPVPRDFNQKLRELCDEFGALLIFDEVVTGFRLGMGGAQGYFGVRPDLTIFGKCITGGYPMAGDRLTQGLQEIIKRYKLPFVVFNQGSIVHLETSGVMLLDLKNPIRLMRELKPRKHMMEEMGAAYMSQGVVTLAGSRIYTSMADTDEVIDEALDRFETVLSSVEGVT
jgi:glutamate-1-semialdehyde 2,1-aminomutase